MPASRMTLAGHRFAPKSATDQRVLRVALAVQPGGNGY